MCDLEQTKIIKRIKFDTTKQTISKTIIKEFEQLLVLHKCNMEILFSLKEQWCEEDGNLDEWNEFYKRDKQRLRDIEQVLNYYKKENKNYLHEFLKEKGGVTQ